MTVERDGDITRVVVAMTGLYAPVPSWLASIGLLALMVVPVWVVGTLVVRALRGLEKPPRAVFEVDADRVTLLLRDSESGQLTRHDWPRASVAALRANRYGRGLWVDVPGHMKETLLTDESKTTINRLAFVLTEALEQQG